MSRLNLMSRHPIRYQSPEGALDYLEVDGSGIVRIHGWYHRFDEGSSTKPSLKLSGVGELEPIHQFRVTRQDVSEAMGSNDSFHGMVIEYLLPEGVPANRQWEVYWKSECVASIEEALQIQAPSYPYLIHDERVFHRDWIYCSGLPVDYLNEEVFAIAKTLEGPILDFGCGTGVLAAALRDQGMDVRGLELDRPEIRKALPEGRDAFVDLYDGEMPLSFDDETFESVIMSEVLEHLDQPESAMEELARVCKNRILVTVPDLSGVPLNSKHGVVRWHLLESTHVNFFNPHSLDSFLRKWFSSVQLYRISRNETNGTQWWGGLMALAQK